LAISAAPVGSSAVQRWHWRLATARPALPDLEGHEVTDRAAALRTVAKTFDQHIVDGNKPIGHSSSP
jgi:hypothetical protein